MEISPRKLILALLYAEGKSGKNNEPIIGITRFEKMIFLLTRNDSENLFNKFQYQPDRFGPYSDKLADQIEGLCDLRLIKKTKDESQFSVDELNYFGDVIPSKYELTEHGKMIAKDTFEKLCALDKNKIIKVKKEFNQKSLNAILSFVYNTSGEKWTSKSEIKDKYVISRY